ncbi:MAG: 50S ribosomal protein L29 [Patescibacteria group bacterium]|nr:50S ribosomal protein L29 [Patescibacteria group bacterium]
MKTRKKQELHQKALPALKKQAEDLKLEIIEMKLKLKAQKEKNTSFLMKKRHDLARVLTIITQKQAKL